MLMIYLTALSRTATIRSDLMFFRSYKNPREHTTMTEAVETGVWREEKSILADLNYKKKLSSTQKPQFVLS